MFGFGWVIEGKLAGMSRPGSPFSDLGEDLDLLGEAGVSAIVSLTEEPLDREILRESGFAYRHIPIWDMSAPTQDDIRQFVLFVSEHLNAGKGVSVHCAMGLGRTGTMLANYLVYIGMDAQDAIREVRSRRPGSIETRDQAEAVMTYANGLSEVQT
jgi:atypical dual specificity phosphatase